MVMNINTTLLAGNVVGTSLSMHVGPDATTANALPSRGRQLTNRIRCATFQGVETSLRLLHVPDCRTLAALRVDCLARTLGKNRVLGHRECSVE